MVAVLLLVVMAVVVVVVPSLTTAAAANNGKTAGRPQAERIGKSVNRKHMPRKSTHKHKTGDKVMSTTRYHFIGVPQEGLIGWWGNIYDTNRNLQMGCCCAEIVG